MILLQTLPRVSPALPPLLFAPVVLLLAVGSVAGEMGLAAVIWGGLGLFAWTFAEYLIHRFVFHFEPQGVFGKRLLYLFHGFHHDVPADLDRVVMSPLASVPLAGLFYLVFRLALGPELASPFFAGFLLGFIFYDSVHYAIHHRSLSRHWPLRLLKRRHFRHHFRDSEVDFGVTSPLWDRLLRTASPPSDRVS